MVTLTPIVFYMILTDAFIFGMIFILILFDAEIEAGRKALKEQERRDDFNNKFNIKLDCQPSKDSKSMIEEL